MSKQDFKYKAKFNSLATFLPVAGAQKFISSAAMGIEDLTKLIPSETCGKEHNVCAAFNSAVVNLVNANDDAIATDTAVAIYKDFINQPINIEHDKSHVVGFITNAGFSTFDPENSTLLEESAVSSETGPFNISLSCLLWDYVDDWAVDFLEMTNDEKSYFYKAISASWEIGFNQFHIILGSKKLADATIISDPVEIEKYAKYLRQEGGVGHTPDGTPVYRLIVGNAKPLGCALTSNPAAPVKGVIIKEDSEDDSKEESKNDDCKNEDPEENLIEEDKKCQASENNFDKNDILISQKENNQVINNKSMKFTSQEDFVTKVSEASGIKSDSISEFIQSQMKEGDAKFAQLQAEAKEKEDSLKVREEELSTAKAEMEQFKKELEELKNQVSESAKQDRFSSRLEALSSKYDLDDKTRKFLAKQISDLEDEAYESWLAEDGEIILASKEKKQENVDVEDAIKEAKASQEFVPNAGGSTETKEPKKVWVIGEDVKIS